jgi:glycosyltransferase involved in cell wall biosynthesis
MLALKNNSKQALEKKYEWDYIIDQYIEVFKEVTN